MITYHVSPDDYATEDLSLLDGALQQVVRELDIASEQQRESVAAAILHSFLCGVRDRDELVAAGRNVYSALWTWPSGRPRSRGAELL